MRILVTGGCGFVGSHLVDRLVSEGHEVRAYDLLEPQVHGVKKPSYLNDEAEYIIADIRNKDKLKKSLRNIEVVFHQAAQVGVGQSMYQIEKYTSHNVFGAAVLLELIANSKNKVKKLLFASSMSIYGEGAYKCRECGMVYPRMRPEKQLEERKWQMLCPHCNKEAQSAPTNEEKPLFPTSIYATTKRTQEEMCLQFGLAYKIPTVSLRYFNIYGPRQSLNNPYTGVMAIFLSRLKNNNTPLVFEDGRQSRDFIHVSDIVEANMLAMKKMEGVFDFFNVGTGEANSVLDVAQHLISFLRTDLKPKIMHKFRIGDIRHCYADISKISKRFGFKPKVSLREGMAKLVASSSSQSAKDLFIKAHAELVKRGLVR